MITKIKPLPKSQVALTVELDAKEWDKYRSQALRKLASEVRIPGFRKGHIPEKILMEQVSEHQILAEAVELAIPQTYLDAVEKENIRPIAHPEVKMISETPFIYEATVAIMPEIKVKPLKKLKAKKKEITVEKKEIEEMMKQFQEQLSEPQKVDRAAKKGDIAVVDFAGFDTDGVPLDGTASKGHPVEIGSNQMIPGFEDEMIGLKSGEKKSFQITFPKDYHSQKFASKKVRFEIEVHEVKEKVLPEVNEELVEKLTGTKKPVSELEKEISDALKERKKNEARQEQEGALLEAVEEAVEGEIPEVLIDEEVEYLIDNMKMQGLQYGITWENHLVHLKKSEEDLKKEFRPQALKQVRTRFGVQKFLEVDEVQVSGEEIATEVERALGKMNPEQRKKQEKLFEKNARGWKEAENRIRVSKWIDQKLQELSS